MSGKELQGKIGNIRTYARRLSDQANIAFIERQKGMYEAQKCTASIVVSSMRSQDHGFNTIAHNLESFEQSLNHHHKVLESQRHDDTTRIKSMAESLNNFLSLLKENPVFHPSPASNKKHCRPNSPAEDPQDFRHGPPSPDSTLGRERKRQQLHALLCKLNVDHELADTDTNQQVRLIYILSRESQDRAVALINSPQMHLWLTSTTSSVLHINGQMFFNEHEARQSPLSYTCAKFIDSVLAQVKHAQTSTINPTIVVRWFCGQHTNVRTDYDAHPPGMLNNLLWQVICQLLDLGIDSTSAGLPPLGHDPTLSDLCELFAGVAQSLPPGTILFCILDGVSYYEDAQRRDELTEVLLMLKTLTLQLHEASKGPLIKILTTAPMRSSLASRIFESDEIFNMNERYPPNGGFTALQWDAGIGRELMDSSQDT